MDAVAKRKQLKMAIRDGKSDFGFGFFMRERNCSSTLVLLNTRRTRVAKTWNYSEVRPSHKPQLCCIFPQVGKVVCGTIRWKSIGVVGMNEHRRCYCCNLSGGVVWFTTNGMCVKNNTIMYVALTSNNRVISSGDFYCCLLPRCEALRICRSGFPIATLYIVLCYHFQHVFSGIVSFICGVIIVAMDLWSPQALADFFGNDILQDSEQYYHKEKAEEENGIKEGLFHCWTKTRRNSE